MIETLGASRSDTFHGSSSTVVCSSDIHRLIHEFSQGSRGCFAVRASNLVLCAVRPLRRKEDLSRGELAKAAVNDVLRRLLFEQV